MVPHVGSVPTGGHPGPAQTHEPETFVQLVLHPQAGVQSEGLQHCAAVPHVVASVQQVKQLVPILHGVGGVGGGGGGVGGGGGGGVGQG